MSNTPRISVITAVYNGESHLEECLESISEQTFSNYEHIIVDDGSTDNTPEILKKWQSNDQRIKVLRNTENRGRSISRNRAIMAAKAPLIAVLDADDCALPHRLAVQTTFLQEHPEVQILGGGMYIYDSGKYLQHPDTNDAIRAALFFDSAVFHSTSMMRRTILDSIKKLYSPALPLAQDYGLWADMLPTKTAVFANLAEPLVRYRMSVGVRPHYEDKQFQCANLVRIKILEHLKLPATNKNLKCHLALLFRNAQALSVTPAQCAQWGKLLQEANARLLLTTPEALEYEVSRRIEGVFRAAKLQQIVSSSDDWPQ